jgi:hypothetical protein
MRKLRGITHKMLADIMNELDDTFDNHRLEQRLLRKHTIAFAETLLEFKTAADPLRAFSAAFGRMVGHEFDGQIRKNPVPKTETPHLGGDDGPNQRWKKVTKKIT